MQYRRQYQIIGAVISGVVCTIPALAESQLPYDTEPTSGYSNQQLQSLAEKIGISGEIESIKKGETADKFALLHAENYVNKKIASAYFDCSAVSAELLREEADVRNRRLNIEQQRNARILTTNSLNFLSRGAISAPALGYSINPKHLPTNGNILGSVANGTSTLLSVVALAEGSGGKSKKGSGVSILAPLFFDDAPRDKITPYVWVYLNSSPLDQSVSLANTHRERLTANWTKSGLAPSSNTVGGRQRLRRMLELGGNGLTVSELKKREAMLHGFRITVLQMTKGLEQLSRWM